jgi:hypothetical protein
MLMKARYFADRRRGSVDGCVGPVLPSLSKLLDCDVERLTGGRHDAKQRLIAAAIRCRGF